MSDVTRILSAIEEGDPSAADLLLPLVYDELRKLAAAKLAQEKPGQTLQATALVHGRPPDLGHKSAPSRRRHSSKLRSALGRAVRSVFQSFLCLRPCARVGQVASQIGRGVVRADRFVLCGMRLRGLPLGPSGPSGSSAVGVWMRFIPSKPGAELRVPGRYRLVLRSKLGRS